MTRARGRSTLAWFERCASIASASGRTRARAGVFVSSNGEAISKFGFAESLRAHVEANGLKQERPELFTTSAIASGVHDLRGTLVTLSLAAGRSESWIADRIGYVRAP